MRTFTLQEAQKLVPVLETLLRSAMKAKSQIEEVEAELQQLNQRIFTNGGLLVDVPTVARRKRERNRAVQQAKDTLGEIDSTGVQVKDLDIGLLDFPCLIDDQVVLLCWKLGESQITHWHGVEEGFGGRKPIDARIANNQDPKRPN